jgi:broad specificity phosphatase PhoE
MSLSLIQQAELVVVSPLTRALQTACHIFSAGVPPPFICHPAVAEIGGIPENNARPLSALCKDSDLNRLQPFASIDFSLLGAEPTWPPTARVHKQSRAAAAETFLAWLRERPEQIIVVVSHHNFLQGLLKTTASVANCAPIVVEVDVEGRVGGMRVC